jgi:tetratricopeptide (TPR) repeat protein
VQQWRGSHHDLAMQVANESTVLGDFDEASFTYNGIRSAFFRRDGDFFIRTDGPDGALDEFRVTHTFGVDPLQQYLVELPGGRYQVTTLAWDTRPVEAGGQRWFTVHLEDGVDSDDPLHWTGVFQNWNSSCAACHSTNLLKNYFPTEDAFATTFSSIDVDCEACHGPGSLHARAPEAWPLVLSADESRRWVFVPGEVIARRLQPRTSDTEIETCAQCHSRRGQIGEPLQPGQPLLDAFRPALIDAGLYFADGQILDEVYVYGSFLQSRMYAAGVTCSDCHDPHSNRLKLAGNAVCAQCHLASSFETAQHHHHAVGESGSACVDCHMTAKTYMVVDPRRDHSFRVPRPDLSPVTGAPDACTGCHSDRSAEWAAAVLQEWFPGGRSGKDHYGEAIAAGRNWDRDRAGRLSMLVANNEQPAIVRGAAISLLGQQLDNAAFEVTRAGLDSDEPLIQLAAIDTLGSVPAELRLQLLGPFLTHPSLALRTAAARQLAFARNELPQGQRADLDAALEEFRATQVFNADRPEGWMNIAALHIELGELVQAEESLRTAIERFPWFAASYINLADLYRREGRNDEAESLLMAATEASPEDPGAWFALGLAQVRGGQSDTAVEAFRRSVELVPDQPYYRYVLGVALNSTGSAAEAIEELERGYELFPGYRDIPLALATMYRDSGNKEAALRYARELLDLSDQDPAALRLINELETP